MTEHFASWSEGVEAYEATSVLYHAPSTRGIVHRILGRFERHTGGRTPDRITRSDVELHMARLTKAGSSPATVNKMLRHLRAFFAWLEGGGYVERNPTKGIRPLRVISRRQPIVSDDKIGVLLAHLTGCGDEFYADLVCLIANTGLRLGEAMYLKAEDVDLEKATLEVRCRVEYLPKDRQERTIPVNVAAHRTLSRRVLISGGEWLFTKKGRVPGVNSVSHGIQLRARRAGIGSCSWYQLRHAFATRAASVVPEHALAALLGHSSPATTRKFYVHYESMRLVAPPVVG